MKPISFGPDGANAPRRAYHRSRVRRLLRVSWAHRGLNSSDVMIASYPRSGNLWVRFMLVELLHGDATFERVNGSAPYVGRHHTAPRFLPQGRRLIKTHEPYIGRYRVAIHLVRDPRDVVISYFKFLLRNEKLVLPPKLEEQLAFDRFVDAFIAGRVDPHGTWNSHLASWVEAAEGGHANVKRVRFEELRADPIGTLGQIADWLGAEVSIDDVARAVERCSVDRMRAATAGATQPGVMGRPMLPPLVSDGTVGGWRDILTQPQIQRFYAFADGLQLMGYPLS